jgi:hypothetical protein
VTSELRQMTLVSCPTAQAVKRIETFVKTFGVVTGGVTTIPFGFDLASTDGGGAVRVEHGVRLHVSIEGSPSNVNQVFAIDWKPSTGGPFPSFDGELTIENENYDSFWLELRGTYRPPFGVLGSVFDAIAGKRIAAQSARELLAKMASSIEAGFQADEASKPSEPAEPRR